jgi:hypothetical protein
LRSIDQYSEFLKDLIVAEEKQVELRRRACVRLYLTEDETRAVARELEINVDQPSVEDIPAIEAKLRVAASSQVSKAVCKCAALCALNLNDEYLKEEAIGYCRRLVAQSPDDPAPYFVSATIKWALGRSREAISDSETATRLAQTSADQALIRQGKNSFVYLVTDWKSFQRKEDAGWSQKASAYVKELSVDADDRVSDTLGFYWIVFGHTVAEVEQGRGLVRAAHSGVEDPFRPFAIYHEFIALHKLLRMLDV